MIPRKPGTEKLALVMVGLPARGKTFISRKIARYLCWLGYRARVFNVGDYRRALAGTKQPAQFFDPQNSIGYETRVGIAMGALGDMIAWFRSGGEVGIYDATNTERRRRQRVYDALTAAGVQVVFVESICEDESVVEGNVRDTKLRSPDYADTDPEEAVRDFRARIAHYEGSYEPLDDPEKSYVKIIDVGRQFVVNRLEGYLSARLIFFLMNIHPARRTIWLTRHGECEYNVLGRIGGDTELSPRGLEYSRSLARFMVEQGASSNGMAAWTSTLRRTVQTAQALETTPVAWRALDEIDAGVCDAMTYGEIKEQLPDEYAARASDKFRYRYPRGESYGDVIQRLEPVIVELERQRVPVLVIGHQAVVRSLYGYLMGRPQDECPYLPVPLHTVIALTPNAYGYEERRYALEPQV
ncbi:MAG TPA: 6-phosphofructo-2-kinase/fructose-2,6-bisphosphatase [Polyangiaceae bacterium]|nr:6-phosphofructo-2-kinase/fructose-2,6-bisphosphatase [Polyangiaceae bacterium]